MQNAAVLISHAPEILVGTAASTLALVAALTPDEKRARRVALTVAYMLWIATVGAAAVFAILAVGFGCWGDQANCGNISQEQIIIIALGAMVAPAAFGFGRWATRALQSR